MLKWNTFIIIHPCTHASALFAELKRKCTNAVCIFTCVLELTKETACNESKTVYIEYADNPDSTKSLHGKCNNEALKLPFVYFCHLNISPTHGDSSLI